MCPVTSTWRRAIVVLFCLNFALTAVGYFWLSDQAGASRAAQQHGGQVLEEKLCGTFGKLAALKPPAGNPETNPSRAYLQGEHMALDEIGADLGCGRESQ